MPGPYGTAARGYLAAGWGSPLPLPAARKKSPPEGWTGRDAPDASAADIEAWCEEHPDGNIGMRLCEGIIGIDVDAHRNDQAAAEWQELLGRYGPLPPWAPWCTSRDDGISGIRLFRVPPGYIAAGVMGGAGEVIQRHHRYVVVPPSLSPAPPAGSGRLYRWVNLPDDTIPHRDDLPLLPTAWQDGLRAGTGAREPGGGSTWTNPALDQLAAHGIPDGANQDEYLRDLAFKLASQGVSEEVSRHVWFTIVSKTQLSRPGEPWTDADFLRHWHGAVTKLTRPREPAILPPAPEKPARLLDSLHAFTGRFVAYPSESAHVAHTLWIAHAHFMEAWESTPRIAFLSPEPNSGKTRALEISLLLVPRPVEAVNTTPAYLFRKVSDPDGLPTILYDEIDTLFGPKAKDNEEIRGMLNAGHRRGAVAGRCVIKGKLIETEELPAYCAVALAGLGDLPDTLLSRAIVIRMRRRAPGEVVEGFRHRVHKKEGHALRDQVAAWAAVAMEAMREQWPDMPAGIEDRDADVWEAPLAIADAAGGDWPERARVSAVTLVSQSKADSPSLGIRLLSDLRVVFENADVMFTEAILNALHELDESPWSDLKGKPLNSRGLAHRLRQYDVKSQTVRLGDVTAKGYKREDLHDPWSRYLSPVHIPSGGTSQTTANEPPTLLGEAVGPSAHGSVTSDTTSQACEVCGLPLDPKLAVAGILTHPNCEPESELP